MPISPKQMLGIIAAHRTKADSDRKRWDKYRSWYLSEYWQSEPDRPTGAGDEGDDSSLHMETNYPYAYVDTMVANVCPTNPQVTVNARRKALVDAARYREALVNDTLRKVRAHRILWKLATQASVYQRGFVKAVWSFRKESADFIVVDPRNVFFDLSASRWEDIRYIIEVTVIPKDEFESRTKKKGRTGGVYKKAVAEKANFGGYPSWLRDNIRDKSMLNEASRDVYEWATVYECYDFSGEGQYCHMLGDIEEPLFVGELPYRSTKNPFQILTFNENLSDLGGLSDVKLISAMQERLNELDTLELWFAQSSIPITLLQSGLVDNPETIKSALREVDSPGAIIDVHGKANAPLRDLIGATPTPTLSPSFKNMRERASQVIEFVLGIPQYSRGVVGVSDVATEVALADTATRTRNGRRIKEVHDIVNWMAQTLVGLFEEFLPEDDILPIRLTDSRAVLEVTRKTIAARKQQMINGEAPLEYDYEAIVYSPTENSRLVQLKNLTSFLPMLLEAPQVDKERLVSKLLELLQMRDILLSEEQQEEQKQQQAAQAAQMQPQAGGEDTIATGALPPQATEPPMPVPSPVGGPGQGASLPGFAGSSGGFKGAGFKVPGVND